MKAVAITAMVADHRLPVPHSQPLARREPIGSTAATREFPKMRVLHAMPEVWIERTQSWLHTQIASLPAAVESHVVCNRTMLLDEFPFPRIHCRADASALLRAWYRFEDATGLRRRCGWGRHVVHSVRPDLIHSHFGSTAWAMLPAARRGNIPHVATFYGLDVNCLPRLGWAERYQELFADVDLVLCEGPHMQRCIVALGCASQKVGLHRLGVDLARIPFQPRTWRPGQTLRVLLAASFREKKGLPYAIAALGRLRHELPIEVTVLGGPGRSHEEQIEARAIEAAIVESRLGAKILLRGFQPYAELLREAYRHHVYLAPSVTARNGDTEGGAPVTVIEMAASGMPVVSTRHCDIPDIVQDGVTGLLADERDVNGLVGCMLRLVAEYERWPTMLAAARQRVEVHHDARQQSILLAQHYARLSGRG
ncbi:MAG: glycosyltransferase [Planctomycetota bacterium]